MLSLLAWLYGRVVALRNYLYHKGILDVHDLRARTISIGNITVGGTGKTPLVAYVAREAAARGEKVCILSRGYGRENAGERVLVSDGDRVLVDASRGGDEPVELANKLLGTAIVIADADRVGAAEWALRKFGVTAFVLDDAFQHRRVRRNVDIVCVDATDPFGGGQMLPAGRLREPVENLDRANVIVITRVEQVGDILDLRSQISEIAPAARVVECRTRLEGIRTFTAETQRCGGNLNDAQALSDKARLGQVFAFCALGNPENFFSLLRESGIAIAGTREFIDHHRYTQDDLDEIQNAARDAGAEALITTAKDAVKLAELRLSIPCFVAEIEIELDDPAGFAAAIVGS
ncbi:MAG: tetraacyldisaccharide 4'-kinase [Pyrinomonadaceae bacterium]